MAISIEPAPEVKQRVYGDCGGPFSSVYGFLSRTATHAVYHARSEVLGTPLEREALRTVEFLITHDPRISEHLR
jgi:hypothetical protein